MNLLSGRKFAIRGQELQGAQSVHVEPSWGSNLRDHARFCTNGCQTEDVHSCDVSFLLT